MEALNDHDAHGQTQAHATPPRDHDDSTPTKKLQTRTQCPECRKVVEASRGLGIHLSRSPGCRPWQASELVCSPTLMSSSAASANAGAPSDGDYMNDDSDGDGPDSPGHDGDPDSPAEVTQQAQKRRRLTSTDGSPTVSEPLGEPVAPGVESHGPTNLSVCGQIMAAAASAPPLSIKYTRHELFNGHPFPNDTALRVAYLSSTFHFSQRARAGVIDFLHACANNASFAEDMQDKAFGSVAAFRMMHSETCETYAGEFITEKIVVSPVQG